MADITNPEAWLEEILDKNAAEVDVFITGPSGAGKSTYAKKTYPNHTVISTDEYEVRSLDGSYRIDWDRLRKDVAKSKKPVVVEGMAFDKQMLEEAKRKLVINPGKRRSVQQRIERGRKIKDPEDVDRKEAERMWKVYQEKLAPEVKRRKFEKVKQVTSDGIRKPEEVAMKKKAQVDPIEPIAPVGRTAQRQKELEAWQRWSQDKNPDDFKFLLESFKPFMYSMGRRYFQTATLPKSAVEADMIQHFHRALETYDPTKGAQLHTHVGNHLQHTGRFLRTYQNIGKIPEPRARQIGMFQARETVLSDTLGRPPSAIELADDMGLQPKEIELLRKEIRKDILMEPTTEGLADIAAQSPKALEQLQFLHFELNPEQQNILEHTYGLYGQQPVENNEELAQLLGMTPQKVRAIKRQIAKRFEKRYR